MRFVVLALSIPLFAAAPGSAISPYLVRDISQVSQPISSNPESFVSLGAQALFWAGTEGDLWASDGTTLGTQIIRPGFVARPLAQAGDTVYFDAFENGSPFALWSSRGSAGTTQFLAAFSRFSVPSRRVVSVPGERRIFFTADDGVHGPELWTSDGTPVGTHLVIDLRPGSRTSEVQELTWFKGRLYFTGDDGRGFALWSTDGSVAGTRRIRAFTSVSNFGARFLRALPNRLVYFGPERNRGYELWTSDGTPAGTVPLPEIAPGNPSPLVRDAIVVGNRYYTIASDGRAGFELWTTDGTAGGTRSLTRLAPADPLDIGFFPYQLPNRLVFFADDGAKGREPWVSDGTVSGTKLLADLCPGACSSTAGTAPSPANGLLIVGETPLLGRELWGTDGTPAGTKFLKDICPGSCSSNAFGFHRLGGRTIFSANDGSHGDELWSTDATPAGTVRVSNLTEPMPFGSFFPAAAAGGNLLFPGEDAAHGRELWATRGRRTTTRLVADLEPGQTESSGSLPSEITSAGSRSFFIADDGIHGWELWSSDGTAEGTYLSSELVPGAEPQVPPSRPRASGGDGHLIFAASDISVEHQFWIADGTPEGTVPILGFEGQYVNEVKVVGGRPYFVASDYPRVSSNLWQTDWTGVPRTLIAEGAPSWLHDFGGRLLFTQELSEEERGLFIYDGAPGGARRLANVVPQSEPSLFDGELWFFGRDELESRVWSTDGTAAGTRKRIDLVFVPGFTEAPIGGGTTTLYLFGAGQSGLGLYASDGGANTPRYLGPIGPGFSFDHERQPVVLADRLFFEAGQPDEPAKRVLWTSDGTPGGTAPLRDRANDLLLNPVYLQIFGGKVVGFLSHSWFVSDGTPLGTSISATPDADLDKSGCPAQAANRLFFAASSAETGTELWALQP